MAELSNCVFCNNPDVNLMLFTKKTLKKCETVLKHRKAHNLKFKDVVLPVDLFDSVYHKHCYKSFTGLMKKYYLPKSKATCSPKGKKTNVTDNASSACSLTSELYDTQCIEPQSSVLQPLSPSTDLIICDPITMPESTIVPELVEPVPSNSHKNSVQLENNDSPWKINTSVESDVSSTDQDNVTCIFCGQKTKKHRSKRMVLFSSNKKDFLSKVDQENENCTELVNKIANYSHSNIFYHNICQLEFSYKTSSDIKITRSHWHNLRQHHQSAFEEICSFIEENVIKNGRYYFLTYLHRYYMNLLEESAEVNFGEIKGNFTPHNLEIKILKLFHQEVKFFIIRNKKILAPKSLIGIDDQSFENSKDENIINKAALILRKSVLKIEKKKLPQHITAQNLRDGEASVPQDLLDFYFTLIAGSNRKRKEHPKCIRQVKSYCEDIVYGVHNGKVKTSKHIMLGIALKSLTSSRKIIDIIHRYGHCISYPGVEELETEATYTSIQKSSVCPETIKKSPHLCTGVAFDNFDRFVETKSGKDTLHDTVGIIYQNVDLNTPDESQLILPTVNDEVNLDSNKRRRRTFEAIPVDIHEEPFPKKMKTKDLELSAQEGESSQPVNLQLYKMIDTIWMVSHALQLPNVPMWVGFNCLLSDSNSPKQVVSYLTPINASPTNKTVVLETMKQSKKICEEVKQTSIQVTYDLAIAKVALQIQATKKPDLDNLFIHLGPFHIMMAYFKAVGKVIIDCGLTNIMVQSNLLASGSVSGFLEGKHFNRCKRLHPLMAVALEILHFKSFLEVNNTVITDQITEEITRLRTSSISSFRIENEELSELLINYNIYKQQTLNGEFGKTPQFYLTYINLVHYYLTLSRSVRTGDFELFKFVLPKITNLFFICNQQNYARWTVKYNYNLQNVAQTHPDLYEQFQRGFFGIQRTNKPFSKQPIDLVLEQTINADAARRLTGIIQFTNSISARQRWALSHDIRSTIISYVYKDLDLRTEQDVTADLTNHNMKNNIKQLQTFIDTFDHFINPFDAGTPKDLLINIASGKAASEPVEKFLLNIEDNGDIKRKTFIAECEKDENRFDKSIKKTPLENFSLDCSKKTKTKIGGKVQEVRIQRDLFGRMLGISIDHKVDIAKILSYPITPVPLSMCHFDGAICKTQKSILMKSLEKGVEHNPPSHIDVAIIDGFFLLHGMKNVPKTFGSISKKMLQMVIQLKATRFDVIFDQYFSPSIKAYERSLRRESTQLEFKITGPDQVRPSDFAKELKNIRFKQALVDFFILHWATDEMVPFIGNKRVYINFRQCHSFSVSNNILVSNIDENLSCPEHEEADTKIVYHVCNIDAQRNFVIRCSDTDVAAIMLGNMHHLKNYDSHVWILTGTGNNLRYVDVTKIYEQLGSSLCRSIPGFHAITGCDYNPAFFKKGKQRPFSILKKSEEYQKAFIRFGELDLFSDEDLEQSVFNTIQKFICEVYNVTGIMDVDAARLQLFINAYTVSDINEKFNRKNVKNFDASNLPPCKSELLQQFRRANYISSLWNNAYLKELSIFKPENNGWMLQNNNYYFNWFDGDQLPGFVRESLEVESDEESNDVDDDKDLNIPHQHWLDDELPNFDDDDNDDY